MLASLLEASAASRASSLRAFSSRANLSVNHQGAEAVVFEPNVEVHPIDPHINVLAAREVAPAKGGVFFLPAGGLSELGHEVRCMRPARGLS